MIYKSRDETVDGLGPWTWIASDTGAWDGPKLDWENSHKDKYTKYLKKNDVVFCAGGNMGMYPKLLSKLFKFVYTFEPDPHNFHCLVNNCEEENIFKFNCALGAEHKMMGMTRPGAYENAGMHRMVEMQDSMIPILKLDDFNPPYLDFLQLDVEGYESEIILGGLRLIDKFRPVISCENGNDTIATMLSPYGYVARDWSVSDTIYTSG